MRWLQLLGLLADRLAAEHRDPRIPDDSRRATAACATWMASSPRHEDDRLHVLAGGIDVVDRGQANAAVLPEPVCACPITSRPRDRGWRVLEWASARYSRAPRWLPALLDSRSSKSDTDEMTPGGETPRRSSRPVTARTPAGAGVRDLRLSRRFRAIAARRVATATPSKIRVPPTTSRPCRRSPISTQSASTAAVQCVQHDREDRRAQPRDRTRRTRSRSPTAPPRYADPWLRSASSCTAVRASSTSASGMRASRGHRPRGCGRASTVA
jgi:hypothetical protein